MLLINSLQIMRGIATSHLRKVMRCISALMTSCCELSETRQEMRAPWLTQTRSINSDPLDNFRILPKFFTSQHEQKLTCGTECKEPASTPPSTKSGLWTIAYV